MTELHYLTVQDVLWMNLQVTRKVQHFRYARLEEAVYYQYAYGENRGLVAQAARLAGGFLRMHPFEAGNVATAFLAVAVFLRINGTDLELGEGGALALIRGIGEDRARALPLLDGAARPMAEFKHAGTPDIRGASLTVLNCYASEIAEMAAEG